MSSIEKLAEIFSKFPGIGPRQSRRFVYFLLTKDREFLQDLSSSLLTLKKNIRVCEFCQRFYQSGNSNSKFCNICSDSNRNNHLLMVVEKDADLENIEKTEVYNGKYFVLGGIVPILEEKPESKVRSRELVNLIEGEVKNNGLNEIILATSANPEGENTHSYLLNLLRPITESGVKVSTLGRGLSTGTELEYSDKDTLKAAFENRH
ncbi:MAG TPA: toprim domain-containing protein [Candidatus Paceibacterota bacterium]|jgi:recombination protein RecR|nr:recombination protein RecR [Parcubacteria group bacterium]MDP6119743.1 toprim domain-containing protein [Candidatus Paceibacterota bacterium]HJN63041.1 toprim domain-containing protein [Candidatus Paceibacterota bacterium]|tara:strand:- start:3124 stop:3741 length:618 start_codon:yes stop_codon:yes gene_type:complete